ncbi:uncharacterized protein C8Q71DRAFT_775114 [Rhodofomes roseus]|uniref:RING-type domain-containing protein n=1 Tax=Rhodofomes roseus TaxID=34475 RepID=A0ABQ8K7Y3_9APHY|nr:uncharacterized protein C8Q71DRAFT_775114 [Rhodofomes roseus]KAH9833338.1 hypothetical protein C8Q71DRAFT_775114 [Rhodofomes roseus]
MSWGGMPLLSGPPPEYATNEPSCRKCDKEFNLLFARSRKCNHCGYLYCHSCTDFQALIPRSGSETGYDPAPVCAFCIDNLTITAGGKNYLRSLPLARLKKYANAYHIGVNGVLEKDDLIDTLMAVRERNGCLPRVNEHYYRKNSVPNRRSNRPRGLFTRAMDAMGSERTSQPNSPPRHPQPQQQQQQPPYQPRQRTTSGPSSFPRPDLEPDRQPQGTYAYPHHPPPPPRESAYRPPPPPRPQTTPSRSHLNVPRGNQNTSSSQQARGRTRAASASSPSTPRASSPAPPVPTLDELLEMSGEDIARLSIGTLKAVLFQNHVNARLVVEKAELVAKVRTLVEDERRERERHAVLEAAERAAEEEARREREEARRAEEARRRGEEDGQGESAMEDVRGDGESAMHVDISEGQPEVHADVQEGPSDEAAPPPPPKPATPPVPPKTAPPPTPPKRGMSPKAQAKAAQLERTGLCVICQDEEANIAIVDCGHLCLCRACSDLIMKSSRECPLCRTRIVTEQRLLRIFKS